MKIESLELTNCGRHSAVTFDSAGSVVGILGPNGAGKSTVLTMLEFLFTGETEDPIDTYVRDYEGNGVAKAKFWKNGKVGTIMRQFGSTPKRELVWDGRTLKAAKEVDAVIAEIFGADKKAVANAVFIQQGVLENILFTLEGERKKAFIRLVSLSHCEQRARVIEVKLRALAGTITDLGPARDAALEQRRLALETLDRIKLELTQNWQAELDYLLRQEKGREQLQDLNVQIGQHQNELLALEQQINGRLAALGYNTLPGRTALGYATIPAVQEALTYQEKLYGEVIEGLTYCQSVQAQFRHYARVKHQAGEQLLLVKALDQETQELNPLNHTLEQWEQELAGLDRKLKTLRDHDSVAEAIAIEEADLQVRRQSLAALVVPAATQVQVSAWQQEAEKLGQDLHWMNRILSANTELQSCVTVTEGQPVACHKCGLVLQADQVMNEAEMQTMQARIQEQTARRAELLNMSAAAAAALQQYDRQKTTLEGQVTGVQGRLARLRHQQGQLPVKPAETAEQLQTLQTETHTRLARLKAIPGERKKATTAWSAALAEKGNYPLAALHEKETERFSDAVIQAKTQEKNSVGKIIEQLRQALEELGKWKTRQEERGRQIQELQKTEQVKVAELETEPRSERLDGLFDQMLAQPENQTPELTWAAVLAEIRARQLVYQTGQAQLKLAESNYDAANQRYHELEERINQDRVKRELMADLKALRDLLLDDGLPMAFVRCQFEHLARLTQESLTKISANFAIQIDRSRELAFSFVRLDETSGTVHAMNKLSGGQRVRLCVAFLMAVQQCLVKDVGLLVLDEPSTHLDQNGVTEVVQFLQGMQQTLQNTDHQIIVVDHHPAMENALEKCLKLG